MNTGGRPAVRLAWPSAGRVLGGWGAAALLVASVTSGCGSQAASPTPSATPMASATLTPSATPTPATTPTPTPSPAPTPTPIGTGARSSLAATVAPLVGEDTAVVYLTEWEQIRGDRAVPADPEARFDLLRELVDRAPASVFGLNHSRGHREDWGWDSLDLAWEATVQGDAPPLYVLALRPGIDLDAIRAHLAERDFAVDERSGIEVFSRPLSLTDDWVGTTELAIHNTAILPEARLMILSSSRDAVDVAVDALAGSQPEGASPAPGTRASAFLAAVGGLGPVDAAVVELRADLCSTYAPRDDPDLGPVAARLHPWTALAAGWGIVPSGATARLVFAYADPAFASADLAGRARLAREGSGRGGPLAEAVFQLDDTRAEGSLIVMDVSPVGGRPARILSAFVERDLVFAACG